MTGVRFPEGATKGLFSLHIYIQTGTGAHSASYPVGSGDNMTRGPGREADHSPPSSCEIKNVWSYTSVPPYFVVVWHVFQHRDTFTFAFVLLHFYCQVHCHVHVLCYVYFSLLFMIFVFEIFITHKLSVISFVSYWN
jgi:hypothetical protein